MWGEGLKRKHDEQDILEDDKHSMKVVPKGIVKVEWLLYFSKLQLKIVQAKGINSLFKIDDLFQ